VRFPKNENAKQERTNDNNRDNYEHCLIDCVCGIIPINEFSYLIDDNIHKLNNVDLHNPNIPCYAVAWNIDNNVLFHTAKAVKTF